MATKKTPAKKTVPKSKSAKTVKPAKLQSSKLAKTKPATTKSVKAKTTAKTTQKSVAESVKNSTGKKNTGKQDWTQVFQPLEDRILVQVEEAEKVTRGGIIIPATTENKSQRARVLATGQGKRNKKGNIRPLDVQVGDLVMFGEYSGTKINILNTEVLILNETDVLGVVE